MVRRIISAAKNIEGKRVADIGSGDGRIIIAFAKMRAIADGFEINPVLVKLSQNKIKKFKLENSARIFKENFWKKDFGEYDVVTVFGVKNIMKKLEEKLQKELKPGAIVVSNYFTFPNWKPERIEKGITVYMK